jgi:hypothetical protein
VTCPNCNTSFETSINNCITCGYPFNGSESQKSAFIAQQIMKVGEIDDSKKSVKGAKITLFFIGGIMVLTSFLIVGDLLTMGISIVIGFTFGLFGVIVERNPFVLLSIALSLLIMLYILSALVDPYTLLRGIIWKIAFITAFVVAMVRVKRAEKIRSESEYLKGK